MLNRRTFFGTTAAVAIAATPLAVQAAVQPDAELVALGAAYERAKFELDEAARVADLARQGDAADAADEQWEKAYSRFNEIEDKIVALPCHSLDGLKVKAMVAKYRLDPVSSPDCDWKDICALSVVDFILSGGLG
ncbi:hypothetical protein [Brevundimonas diminuta]